MEACLTLECDRLLMAVIFCLDFFFWSVPCSANLLLPLSSSADQSVGVADVAVLETGGHLFWFVSRHDGIHKSGMVKLVA
jgi:hypothetical protein